jgi:hypothetical protein
LLATPPSFVFGRFRQIHLPYFVELRHGEVQHSPAPIGQGSGRGDAHIVGYYAPAAKARMEEGLGDRDGAERQSEGRAVGGG